MTDTEVVRLLQALNQDGVNIRWQVEVYRSRSVFARFTDQNWVGRYIDIDYCPTDRDSEWVGRWLADWSSDRVEVDWCDGEISGAEAAWSDIEEVIAVAQEDEKWLANVRHAFFAWMDDYYAEIRAEVRAGHPSLTAYERNPGLAGRRW